MSDAFLANLVRYSAQVGGVTLVAGAVVLLLHVNSPHVRHRCWRLVLGLCLLLPWLQGSLPTNQAERAVEVTSVSVARAGDSGSVVATIPVLPGAWPDVFAAVLIAGMVVRSLWLGLSWYRFRHLRRRPGARLVARALTEAVTVPEGTEIRYVPELSQPLTYGVRRPVVLLPESLRDQPPGIQQAVLCHELWHVRRRDWLWMLAEEAVRTVLWFHPAIWWLIGRIQLTREEVVDALVVRTTGDRRAYLNALLVFADRSSLSPATAFARRSHLFRRMLQISKEASMSRLRTVLSYAVIAISVSAGAWLIVGMFPLSTPLAAQELRLEKGPLETAAQPITAENPIPRRLLQRAPVYPPDVPAGTRGEISVVVTLDQAGRVAEVRRDRVGVWFDEPPADAESAIAAAGDAFGRSTTSALSEWAYDPPYEAPISFPVSFRFAPGADAMAVNAVGAPVEIPTWHVGASRVGDGILPPRKIHDARPVYPQAARDAKVQGVVIVEARVETDGRISHARVLRSVPPLDQAALDAVAQWEFESPRGPSGEAVPILMAMTIQFALN